MDHQLGHQGQASADRRAQADRDGDGAVQDLREGIQDKSLLQGRAVAAGAKPI